MTIDEQLRRIREPRNKADEVHMRDTFNNLAHKRERAPGFLSWVRKMAERSACQQITGMGPDAIPLIMDRLRAGSISVRWFWVLRAVTGADPVPECDRGYVQKMAEHWLAWNRERLSAAQDAL